MPQVKLKSLGRPPHAPEKLEKMGPPQGRGAQWGHHSQKVEKIIFFCKLHRNLQKINYYLFEGLKSKKNQN